MKVMNSFFGDVPPRVMDTMTMIFVGIIRDVGSCPHLDKTGFNRRLIREYFFRHPSTGFLVRQVRAMDTDEAAVETFANFFLREDVPAIGTLSRKMRAAKAYLRERGELQRDEDEEE